MPEGRRGLRGDGMALEQRRQLVDLAKVDEALVLGLVLGTRVLGDDGGAAAQHESRPEDHGVARTLAPLVQIELRRPPPALAPPNLKAGRIPHHPRCIQPTAELGLQPLVAALAPTLVNKRSTMPIFAFEAGTKLPI